MDAVDELGFIRTVATASVRQALGDVAADVTEPWFSDPQPIVDRTCPAGPALYDPGPVFDDDLVLTAVYGHLVEEASYYRLHVFVISEAEIQRVEGYSRWRFAGEERVCHGDVCDQITDGLYISPDEVCDQQLLVDLLGYFLLVEDEYVLDPTPYFDAPPNFGATPSPTPTPVPRCY